MAKVMEKKNEVWGLPFLTSGLAEIRGNQKSVAGQDRSPRRWTGDTDTDPHFQGQLTFNRD